MIVCKEGSDGRINIGTANELFYQIGSGNPCFGMEFAYRLNIKVDPDILKEAVNRALKRFWNFRLKPCLDEEGKLYFTDNKAEASVYPDDGRLFNLGSDETNGFLFAVLYSDNTIKLRNFHGVADGRGAVGFIKTILYHYLSLSGMETGECPGVLTDDIPENESERVSQYETFADENADPFYTFSPDNTAFGVPEDITPLHEGRTIRYLIECDLDAVLAQSKKLHTTMTPFVDVIIASSLYKTYDVPEDKVVIGTCPVDARGAFKVSATANFVTTTKLPYDRKLTKLDMKSQVNIIRALLDLQMTIPNYEKEFAITRQSTIDTWNLLYSFGLGVRATTLPAFKDQLMEKSTANSTYTITNVGPLNPGGLMGQYVEDATSDTISRGAENVFLITSFSRKLYIRVYQGYENSAWLEEITRQLQGYGIKTELSRQSDYYFDSLTYNT